MFRLALRTLRKRKGSFVASFVALFLGAVIVMACGGLMETGIRFIVPPQRLLSPIIVSGSQSYIEQARLPLQLVQQLQAVPGVMKAQPDISFAAALLSAQGQPLNEAGQLSAHGWSSAEIGSYQLIGGSEPTKADGVVLNQSLMRQGNLRLGDTASMVVQGVGQSFRITGEVTDGQGNAPAIFFSDAEAQELSGRPTRIDNIAIFPKPDMPAEQLIPQLNQILTKYNGVVLSGDNRGIAEFSGSSQDREALISIAGVFGGLGVLVTVFIVAATLGISVQQRHREMSLLRAIGATRKQIFRMILGETLFISVIATAFAYVPSYPFGHWLLNKLSSGGVVPPAVVYHQGWLPKLIGISVALLTAVIAAFVTARSATKIRPVEALSEGMVSDRWFSWFRFAFALVFLGGAAALSIVTASAMHGPSAAGTATPEAMLWVVALALLGPILTIAILFLLSGPVRIFTGFSGWLALRNLRFRKLRSNGVIMPVMLVTGLAVSLIYLQTTQAAVNTRASQGMFQGDNTVTAPGGVPLSLLSPIKALPDVQAASAVVNSDGYIDISADGNPGDYTDTALLGLSASDITGATTYRNTSGNLSDLTGETIALSEHQASTIHKKVGDNVSIRLGDGTQLTVRLVAIVPMPAGYDVALLPDTLLVQHTTTGLASQIVLRSVQGSSPEQLARLIQNLSQKYPALQLSAPIGNDQAASQNQINVEVSYLLVAVIIAYATIALVNTIIVTTIERQRELALQRLIGMTRFQTFRIMTIEAFTTGIAGIIFGTIVGVCVLVPFALATKNTPKPDGPFWIYASIVGGVLFLTLLTTWLACIVLLRARPITIARSRE